jgi:hypothetical protein
MDFILMKVRCVVADETGTIGNSIGYWSTNRISRQMELTFKFSAIRKPLFKFDKTSKYRFSDRKTGL